MMAALGVELIGYGFGQLSDSGPKSLTGQRYASMQQRPNFGELSASILTD
jgi:hypothetical protein